MQVKTALDEALLAAGVKFFFSSYVTDVLRDGAGRPCGVVMANRAGRQAVIAKVIIDATDRAWVARMAGASFSPFPAGRQSFRRVVIGGQVRAAPGLTARRTGLTVPAAGAQPAEIIEYSLTIPMADGSFGSFAAAEQQARDLTFDPGMSDEAETLFHVPPDAMKGRKYAGGDWRGVASLEIDGFRPAGVERLYVLSGCADMPRELATRLLRPLALMEMGERIGRAAAEEAKAAPAPTGASLPAEGPVPEAMGEVRECLAGVRPAGASAGAFGAAGATGTVAQAARALPVLGQYDVVVIGGGTGGAPAGIGAARQGARTLVVEHLHALGGVGTVGLIGAYYHGYRGGFTAEVDRGVAAVGDPALRPGRGGAWNVLWKMHWWRSQLRKAGADVWFGAIGCGALVRDGRVIGAVVASPAGRGVVLAGAVIDATGNADVAAAAGAPTMYTDGTCLAVQGTGLPPRALGANYTNTDYTFADETDMVDVWGLFVSARRKYRGAYDMGQLIDTRERRRIVGDAVIGVLDPINGRTFSDTIAQASSDFDSHGYTVHPYFYIVPPGRKEFRTYIPYRAMLPIGLDGLLVIGLGLSAHRDAVPLIRMQPDVQNHGYAAGIAAAAVAKGRIPTRQLNLRPIQEMLVRNGDLPPEVLSHKDSYPIPSDRIAEAVKSLPEDPSAVAVVMTHTDVAVPMLREAYAAAGDPKAKLKYAHVLGVCGDGAGLETLLQAVRAAKEWDKGWNFKGMGQYGPSSSELDSLIYALGQIADRKAVPAILEKVAMLDAGKEFSHHRAVARALESIRDAAAAGPLAELLAKPGMTGYAVTDVAAAGAPPMPHEGDAARSKSLRELLLAAALYRCGDSEGLGRRILTQYAADLRGHYARFAAAVLNERPRR